MTPEQIVAWVADIAAARCGQVDVRWGWDERGGQVTACAPAVEKLLFAAGVLDAVGEMCLVDGSVWVMRGCVGRFRVQLTAPTRDADPSPLLLPEVQL